MLFARVYVILGTAFSLFIDAGAAPHWSVPAGALRHSLWLPSGSKAAARGGGRGQGHPGELRDSHVRGTGRFLRLWVAD